MTFLPRSAAVTINNHRAREAKVNDRFFVYNRRTIYAKNWWIQWRRIWKRKLDDIVTWALQQLGRPTVIFRQLLLRLIFLLFPCQCLLLRFFLHEYEMKTFYNSSTTKASVFMTVDMICHCQCAPVQWNGCSLVYKCFAIITIFLLHTGLSKDRHVITVWICSTHHCMK